VRIQVLVVPICEGSGAIVYSRFWSDPHAEELLQWVIDSSRPISAGPPIVCAELAP
jgi:hypothetical protein